jgi:hypothetical protein
MLRSYEFSEAWGLIAMSEIKLSFDEEQLEKLHQALKHAPQPFWQSENLLRVTQVLALVLGGSWVLIQFLLYQREEIQLKRDELAQSVKLKGHELSSLTTYRFSLEPSIKAKRLGSADKEYSLYEVNYSLILKNVSSEQFEASLWVLDYFIGEEKKLEKPGLSVRPVGYPAGRWNPSGGLDGAIQWKAVGSEGAIFAAALGKITEPWASVTGPLNLRAGGGLTGMLKQDQSYSYEQDFLVMAPIGAYVAFAASFCFDRCKNNDDLYTRRDYTKLPDEVDDGKPAGVKIPIIKK